MPPRVLLPEALEQLLLLQLVQPLLLQRPLLLLLLLLQLLPPVYGRPLPRGLTPCRCL